MEQMVGANPDILNKEKQDEILKAITEPADVFMKKIVKVMLKYNKDYPLETGQAVQMTFHAMFHTF